MNLALPSLLLVAACATVPKPAAPLPDARVIADSHDVLVALDHADHARLDALLARGFVHVDDADITARADELRSLKDEEPREVKRTWSKEHVIASPTMITYRGLVDEEPTGNEVHGNFHFHGYYTLIWVREDEAWRLGFLGWQQASNANEGSWNAVYKERVGFTHEPNHLLVATVAGLKPGRALDVGTGQGRNGLYLASQGWKVTGIDFAIEGLREARETASEKKLDYDPVYADIDKFDFGTDAWDLVTLIYEPDHPNWIEKIKPSLKPGGLFVLEFFAKTAKTPHGTDLAALEKAFAGWQLLQHEVVEGTPDWAENQAQLVRFVAKKP